MAHCPPTLLDDLGDVLAEVRGWVSLDLPRPVSAARRRALRQALRTHYREAWGPA